MSNERRRFSREFKLSLIERLEAGESGTALALESGVKRTIIYRWRAAWRLGGEIVGWAMADHLRAELAIEALEMALRDRAFLPGGLVHHTDRGTQYACGDYIQRLLAAHIQPSMSRAGCPYDNAMAESFMKTLKTEEVDASDYQDLAHATAAIGAFIDGIYNTQRLYSALDYLSPMEFEDLSRPWAAAQQPSPMINQHCP